MKNVALHSSKQIFFFQLTRRLKFAIFMGSRVLRFVGMKIAMKNLITLVFKYCVIFISVNTRVSESGNQYKTLRILPCTYNDYEYDMVPFQQLYAQNYFNTSVSFSSQSSI
jgi:hypothetical protein